MLSGTLPIFAKLITATCGTLNFAILLTELNPSNLVHLSVVQGLTFLFVSILDQFYSGKFISAVKSGENKYYALASVNSVRSYFILAIAFSIILYLFIYDDSVDSLNLIAAVFYSVSWIYAIDWALPYLVSRNYWLVKITTSAVGVSLLIFLLDATQTLSASTILVVYGIANYLPAFFLRKYYLKIQKKIAFHRGKGVDQKDASLISLSALGSLFYNLPIFFISLPKFASLNYEYVVLWRVIGFIIQFIPPVVDNGIAEGIRNKNLTKFIFRYYISISLLSLLIFLPIEFFQSRINFGEFSKIFFIISNNEWVLKAFIIGYALEYASTKLFHIYRHFLNLRIIIFFYLMFLSLWLFIYYIQESSIRPGILIIPAVIMQFIISMVFLYLIWYENKKH